MPHSVLIGRWERLLQTVSESVHNATGDRKDKKDKCAFVTALIILLLSTLGPARPNWPVKGVSWWFSNWERRQRWEGTRRQTDCNQGDPHWSTFSPYINTVWPSWFMPIIFPLLVLAKFETRRSINIISPSPKYDLSFTLLETAANGNLCHYSEAYQFCTDIFYWNFCP